MKQFKNTSLADRVFEKLENDIIFGVYPRGEILTELKLVEQLGVSRTPIREALRRLEQEHLIEDSGKGSVVLGITQDDLLDILNIRLNVEGLAAYYAAMNMTEEGLEQLKHIVDLQEFYTSKGDTDHIRAMDDEFHVLICQLSRRAVIADTLVPLHRKTQRYRKASFEDAERSAQIVQEHRRILSALAVGDAAAAQEAMEAHVANAKDNMLKHAGYSG